jgi:L-alanine-DL-glutamate epimerase-like enolase superfamily enzyme
VATHGLTRERLLQLLPAGGARNALDCALWDLEAKRTGRRAWELAGLSVAPIATPYTLSIQPTPEATAEAATRAPGTTLKIKLYAISPLDRVRAVRAARPDATLIVDANQSWTLALLRELAPGLAELDVKMIEQPLPRGADDVLETYRSPVALCADESCQHLGDLSTACNRYQMINIKLDKAGGLTHALQLAAACRARSIETMVGCMVATSLSMAPAFVLAQVCKFADIDGPLFLKYDRADGMVYAQGRVQSPVPRLWG